MITIGEPDEPVITSRPDPTKPTGNTKVEVTQAPAENPSVTPTPTTEPRKLIRDFVDRIYVYVLDREPEEEGAEYWTDELYGFKRTGAEVAEGFIFSEEFESRKLSDKEFVTILYKTFFDREPDSAGMDHWLSSLTSVSQTRREVAMSFIYSQEWADTCAMYGIKSGGDLKPSVAIEPTEATFAFVERMYTTAMKRKSDEEGSIYWANELSNFNVTGEYVGSFFFLSEEMESMKLSNKEFVTRLYKTFMDREPEKDGFKFWVSQLDNGASRTDAVLGFTRSEEFIDKCIEARILPY